MDVRKTLYSDGHCGTNVYVINYTNICFPVMHEIVSKNISETPSRKRVPG